MYQIREQKTENRKQSNSVRGSFSAKTIWRGNLAGSIAPVGRAALGISTLSRQRGGLCRPGERKTERPYGATGGAPRKCQGAKRRAAVAVSSEAAERPMEPEAVRAPYCVFAAPIFPGQCWSSAGVCNGALEGGDFVVGQFWEVGTAGFGEAAIILEGKARKELGAGVRHIDNGAKAGLNVIP